MSASLKVSVNTGYAWDKMSEDVNRDHSNNASHCVTKCHKGERPMCHVTLHLKIQDFYVKNPFENKFLSNLGFKCFNTQIFVYL